MAEENKDIEELEEFEAKLPAQGNNKDIWLFLIIVDVIFLCVFGFFLYKNLSARLLAPAEKAPVSAPVAEEVAEPEEVQAIEEVVVEEKVQQPAAAPVAEVQEKPAPAVQAPEPQPEKVEPVQPAEQKESVIVKTGKSKYRQVTFRYFGEGDKVSIVSGFTMSKPRALKKKKDYWEVTLGIAPGTYKYLYIVDGKQTPDPYTEQKDGRSVLVVK